MTTKVHSYLGGLGIDATNKFTLGSNATVTVGNGTATGNVHVGGNISIGNISPGAHDLAIAGTALIGTDATVNGDIDLEGSLDVNGTTNLDVVDIDGAVQLDATLTIGANDQGYDVILYGDTASANMTWDTSADDLIFNGAAGLVVPDGQFTLGSTAVTSNASELNLLDGVSGLVQADFTKLAAITSSATEINLLDAITRGSIIYGNASAASARLAKGAEGTVLTAGANDISWAALEAGVGYQNSSTSTVPGTTNTDLGNLTDASQDAFGIASSTKYDLMDPIGSLVSLDLGAF